MAIVDIKHTQTIEEAFSQVAEGGGGGETPTGPVPKWEFHGTYKDLANSGRFVVDSFESYETTYYVGYIILDENKKLFDAGDYVEINGALDKNNKVITTPAGGTAASDLIIVAQLGSVPEQTGFSNILLEVQHPHIYNTVVSEELVSKGTVLVVAANSYSPFIANPRTSEEEARADYNGILACDTEIDIRIFDKDDPNLFKNEIVYAKFTVDGSAVVCSKTAAEMISDCKNGKTVIGIVDYQGTQEGWSAIGHPGTAYGSFDFVWSDFATDTSTSNIGTLRMTKYSVGSDNKVTITSGQRIFQ